MTYLRQWWFWVAFAWHHRRLKQCYRSAVMQLACAFDGEEPPPKGKVWACEMWIDSELCGLGMHHLEDAETGERAVEYEVVDDYTGTFGGWPGTTLTFRPKRLKGFVDA